MKEPSIDEGKEKYLSWLKKDIEERDVQIDLICSDIERALNRLAQTKEEKKEVYDAGIQRRRKSIAESKAE